MLILHVAFLLNNRTKSEEWDFFIYFSWMTIVKYTWKSSHVLPSEELLKVAQVC